MGRVARMEEGIGVYRVLLSRPEGRRPLGRPRSRWGYNIKIELQQVRYGGLLWIDLSQDRDRLRAFVYAVMNLRFPWNAEDFLYWLKHLFP